MGPVGGKARPTSSPSPPPVGVYRSWGGESWVGGSKVRADSAMWGDNSTVSGREEGGSEEEEEEEEEGCVQKGGFSWVGVVSVGELTASPFPLGPTTLYWRQRGSRAEWYWFSAGIFWLITLYVSCWCLQSSLRLQAETSHIFRLWLIFKTSTIFFFSLQVNCRDHSIVLNVVLLLFLTLTSRSASSEQAKLKLAAWQMRSLCH